MPEHPLSTLLRWWLVMFVALAWTCYWPETGLILLGTNCFGWWPGDGCCSSGRDCGTACNSGTAPTSLTATGSGLGSTSCGGGFTCNDFNVAFICPYDADVSAGCRYALNFTDGCNYISIFIFLLSDASTVRVFLNTGAACPVVWKDGGHSHPIDCSSFWPTTCTYSAADTGICAGGFCTESSATFSVAP